MDGITNQKAYVEKSARIVEEKIASVEALIQAGEDKMIVRSAFKELKQFVRKEYETFHKKKYFGTYIFDCYHPLVEGIHMSALGETRVNATVENIQEAVQEAREVLESWRKAALDKK
ncbi:hypothetical protein [Eubacterium sp. 1001713B170207_170306_E7]|uniref:hypothetical protein n=1 Tax=Eubacterium sp. 1001713B170207_170306_E7 TaxID=2787097 RepID=UPI001898A8E6|nr:hypothetical protein [Eubacterium sp. 1001713B170207_170306_E7]